MPVAIWDMIDQFEESLSEDESSLIATLATKIKTLLSLAKYFGNSAKGLEKLKALQASHPSLGCILDVVTRWSSSCAMLERLQVLQPAIEGILAYTKSPCGKREFPDFHKKHPTTEDWFIVECLLKLLKPFRDAIEVLSGEQYCTLALASPVLHLIRRNIEAFDIFEDVVLKYRSQCFDVQSAKSFVMRVQAYLVAQFCNRFANMPVCVIAASE